MSKPRTKFETVCGYLAALVILSLLSVGLYEGVQQRLRYGPAGEMIPADPPDEVNRVVHRSGVSIVAPENWDVIHDWPENPTFTIAARVFPRGRRLTSSIWIKKLDTGKEPDLKGFNEFHFQSRPAYERMVADEQTRGASDRRYSTYDLYIDRDGEWWSIRFDIAEVMTELPAEIREYIETVRFPTSDAP